jgi:hypothetical protein
VFLQVFALFVRFRGAGADSLPLPAPYYAQAVASYAVIGGSAVLSYLVFTGNTVVTDAAGVVWQTRSITEAEAAVSIFTMIFVSVLSGVKMLQASADVRHTSTAARTGIAA